MHPAYRNDQVTYLGPGEQARLAGLAGLPVGAPPRSYAGRQGFQADLAIALDGRPLAGPAG